MFTNMRNTRTIRLLLMGGVVSTPLFYIAAIIQSFTRTGFDIRRHAISTLTLGDLGWIQSTNFFMTGLLSVCAAIGVRRLLRGRMGGKWGSLLIGIYGIGMILAGLFRPDPDLSFPPGASAGMPTSMSVHAALHSVAFFTAFICLIAASIIFARRFATEGERGWSIYCIASCILAPVLIILGSSIGTWIGVIMGSAGIVAFGWVSVLAARLRVEALQA
ncbi:hypothetical protein BK120_03605 [Paenibacillus sp. FSL A5-0031]|uniref:DUF998 domain-containing protein n=1 Tax=Paenibacillus sp. FSL A5-0031 TaxID=1920420 RepID=UPI00096C47BE|nr:DUF998 domain-containing protein [Paenibacillus sp. FSL A5-0031]OME88392.1 hypothetical protein BK120_03605 [Paenibacillus sp. FSL A5-0031]